MMADENHTLPRRRQLTLRTLFLIALILALALGWWVDHRNLKKQIPVQPDPDFEIVVLSLRNSNAQEMVGAIRELFPIDTPPSIHVVSESRTNSIIVRGAKEDLLNVEAILLNIEQKKDANNE